MAAGLIFCFPPRTLLQLMNAPPYRIAVLPGDGIGPEIMREARKVLALLCDETDLRLDLQEGRVGGAAIDADGTALPAETLALCRRSHAILFGSVGGPKWESLPPDQQPERAALLPLRRHFELFANLRPSLCLSALRHASPLRADLVGEGFDILCVRELTGGLYFGQPKGIQEENGESVAVDTMVYRESEIERIGRVAFEAARQRRKRVTSVDKANVLQCSVLWRRVITQLAKEYPDVELEHVYVDAAAMLVLKQPGHYDVMLAENMFGDILSDELAMVAGSIGMLPSASLGTGEQDGCRFGLYEPGGGSAPDIAGKGVANPVAQILSVAMMLRSSLGREQEANGIDEAVRLTILDGLRTADIATDGHPVCGTSEMGDAIVAHLRALVKG